jgi:hypothetical protein
VRRRKSNNGGDDDGRERKNAITKEGSEDEEAVVGAAKEDDKNDNPVAPELEGVLNLDDCLGDDLCNNQQVSKSNKSKKKVNARASNLQDSLIIDDDNMNRSALGILK